MALPPDSNISAPAAEAKGWLVTTMPREPSAGRFSQLKANARRAGSLEVIVLLPLFGDVGARCHFASAK
jgi:hypothetical protein